MAAFHIALDEFQTKFAPLALVMDERFITVHWMHYSPSSWWRWIAIVKDLTALEKLISYPQILSFKIL